MRTLIVCHDDAPLDREGLVRWLGSFSTVAGAVIVREPAARLARRVRREIARVGLLRFVDIAAYRVYYRAALAAGDRRSSTPPRSSCRHRMRQRLCDSWPTGGPI
jgi:hypothetical protein